MAFAAGCAATWAFLRTTFTAPLRTRITELEGMVAAERKRCEAMETRLVQRIQQLEALLLTMSPGHLRQDFQRVLSEQRVDEDTARKEASECRLQTFSAASASRLMEIGRASCREKVCQFVLILGVAATLKKKKNI